MSLLHRKLSILWVEDDPNDVLLVQRASRKFGIEPVHICRNGEDAVRYLQGEDPYDNRTKFPLPNLIITDLNMPRFNGLELLRWLRVHPKCHLLPIVLFSASAEPQDIEAGYRLGASAFFQKPMGFDRLIVLVGKIFDYWAAALPPVAPQKCE
jgi:CheY-like chemotaxis protein